MMIIRAEDGLRRIRTHHHRRIFSSSTDDVSKENEDSPYQPPKQAAALKSVMTCSRYVAASAAIDGVTNWSILSSQRWNQLSVEHALILMITLWKVGFAVGLYRSVKLFRQGENQPSGVVREQALLGIFRILAPLWRQTSWLIVMASAFDLAGIAKVESKGPRYWALACVIFAGSFVFRRLSAEETAALTPKKDEDKEKTYDEDQDDDHVARLGQLVVRNMALCTGSLLFRGTTTGVSVLYQPNLAATLFTASGVQTLFITAGLLWTMRKALLNNLLKQSSRDELWEAQEQFYTKVAGTFKFEIGLKAVGFLVEMVKRVMETPSL